MTEARLVTRVPAESIVADMRTIATPVGALPSGSPEPDGLDVERLARALFRGDIGCEGHGSRTRHQASDHREDAEFIAAYLAVASEPAGGGEG